MTRHPNCTCPQYAVNDPRFAACGWCEEGQYEDQPPEPCALCGDQPTWMDDQYCRPCGDSIHIRRQLESLTTGRNQK